MSGFDNEVVVSLGDRLEPSTAQSIMLMQRSADDVSRINHTGDPEGQVSANPSSLSHDPVSGKVYVKKEGTSSSGWSTLELATDQVGQLAYFSTHNGDAYLGNRWLKCDGRILDQSDHPLLFERIGYINGPFTNYLTTSTFTAGNISALIHDATKFVAGATTGAVGTSTNGINWTATASPGAFPIGRIVFANSIYVLATGSVAYASADLLTYQGFQMGNSNSSNMAYGASVYLGTHSTRYTATSNDGVNWNTRTPQGPHLTVGAGRLVAGSTLNCIFSSNTPSADWQVLSANLNPTANLSDINYINNLFVACSTGTSTFSTSTNGVVWQARNPGVATTWNMAAFGNGVYVLAGQSGGAFRATTDFVTYTGSTTGSGISITNVAYGAGKFVSIQNNTIFTSTDGYTSWTNAGSLPGFGTPPCLKFVNGIFICGAVGGNYATSTDGITWATSTPFGSQVMNEVIFANSLYIGAFAAGNVGSSTDAITWTTQTTLTSTGLSNVAYYSPLYYVSSEQLIQSSTDLITWSRVSNLPVSLTETITSVNFGNSVFLLGTNLGNILTSTDTITWTPHSTITTGAINSVFAGNGIYLAARANLIYRSTDLTTYTAVMANSTTTQTVNALSYVNGLYFAGGNQGYIRTSTDAITWDQVSTTVTNQSTQTVTSSTDAIVFGGNNGALGYSLNVYPYDETTKFQLPTDAAANITLEYPSNFRRALYVRAA